WRVVAARARTRRSRDTSGTLQAPSAPPAAGSGASDDGWSCGIASSPSPSTVPRSQRRAIPHAWERRQDEPQIPPQRTPTQVLKVVHLLATRSGNVVGISVAQLRQSGQAGGGRQPLLDPGNVP